MLIESGVTWLPASLWRINKTWRGVRAEVPWLDRLPSDIVRQHVRLTAQPFDAPPDAAALATLLEQLGSDDMLLFATDYPHWHYDGDDALPPGLPAASDAEDPRRQPAGDLSAAGHGRHPDAGGAPMNVTLRDHRLDDPAQSHLGFIDCDVHPYFRTPADFDPFLSARWREHRRTIGGRSRQGLAKTSLYPRMSPGNGMRGDAWPKDGGPPGSDLGLMREQLLDLFDVRYGLLAPLVGGAAAERNVEFGAAMAVAVNEWQCAAFCDPEPRLKASSDHARARGERTGGNRAARRRCPLRPGEHPAARAGTAGTASLPEDPRRRGGGRLPDLAASRRHQRACLRPAAAGRPSTTRNIPPTSSPCRPW